MSNMKFKYYLMWLTDFNTRVLLEIYKSYSKINHFYNLYIDSFIYGSNVIICSSLYLLLIILSEDKIK